MTRGRKLLVTAGPTHEPVDAVRYLANRSSGRLGVEVAAAGRDGGWTVTLLLGPAPVEPPAGLRVRRFESTEDLRALLAEEFPNCDVLIMAAAVADYRPRRRAEEKLPRSSESLLLELEPTPDLVAECAARKRAEQRIIGFALEEPKSLALRAREKLARKGLDAIVANPLETMGSDVIRATVYTASGEAVSPETFTAAATGNVPVTLRKADFARWLIGWLAR